MYLYHYNPVTNALEIVADNAYTVDQNGYVTINLGLGGEYVLLPKKPEENLPEVQSTDAGAHEI